MAVATTLRAYPFAYPAPLWEIFYRGRARHYGAPRPGRLFASVTEVTKRVLGVPLAGESRLVDAFDDGEDLGEALLATAAVPWLLAAGLSRPRSTGATQTAGDIAAGYGGALEAKLRRVD